MDYFHGAVSKMKTYTELASFFKCEEYYKDLVEKRKNVMKNDTGDYSSRKRFEILVVTF